MNKKAVIRIAIAAPLVLLGFMYGSGYISQFIRNYALWQGAGGTVGDYTTAPAFPSFTVGKCMEALFSFPHGLYGLFVCALLFLILFAFVMKLGFGGGGVIDRARNLKYSDSGSYGTAGFMEKKEIEKVFEVTDVKKCSGIILGEMGGKVVALPNSSRLNRNIAVYGAPGSMKSRAFCRNMILGCIRREESIIITDSKTELYRDTAEYARSQGYCVRVFNLISPENSDSWDCLGEVNGSELMAQTFTDVVIANTGSEREDHFWDNAELNLLKSLVLFVDSSPKGVDKTFPEVYRMITMNNETALNKIFDRLPVTHPAKAPYNIFKQASDTVRSGIIIGLGTRLQILQNSAIQSIISHKEIDLELPGRQKCAYYVVISDQESTFEVLSSLFFSFLFIKLVRYADKHGENGRLPVPVHIIGDEWPNIGKVVDLPQKISTVRHVAA